MLVEQRALDIISSFMETTGNTKENLVADLKDKDLLVRTDDGTFTLRSTAESELMHSRIGALTEAFEKFVLPSELAVKHSPRLLDLCSGLGYNSLAALSSSKEVEIHLLEYSKELLFLGSCLPLEVEGKEIFDKAVQDYLNGRGNDRLKIFCGDARTSLPLLPLNYFDIVFHDGFSPANDPVLYSVEFLTQLKKSMSPEGILLSYSSSIPFRSGLIHAGFHVGEGPAIGRQRGITIAAIRGEDKGLTSRLPLHDEMLIALATVGTPYRDPDLRGSGPEISNRREQERDVKRESGKYLSVKKIKQNRIDPAFGRIAMAEPDSLSAVLSMNKFLLTNRKS